MTYLITAGPTREPIDPVRYITNRSSGKMGYAIAEAAVKAGHRVILISGPTTISIPDSVDYIPVETAQEMMNAVENWIPKAEVAIFTAAVADYRMTEIAPQKLKKKAGEDTMTLTLVKNPDILGSTRERFGFKGVLAGFAAETENVLENAHKKLTKKNCDFIFANDVSKTGEGFDSDTNSIIMVSAKENTDLGTHSKAHLGSLIISHCDAKVADSAGN